MKSLSHETIISVSSGGVKILNMISLVIMLKRISELSFVAV